MKITVITQDAEKTKLMQALDLFKPFKVILGEEICIEAELVQPGTLPKALQDVRETIDKDNNFKVIAVFVPGNPEGAWRDPTVKCVSTGSKWGMFDKYLKALKYPI